MEFTDILLKTDAREATVKAGAVQLMVADVADAVASAATPVGALGRPMVMEDDGPDAGPFPLAFLAVMVKL